MSPSVSQSKDSLGPVYRSETTVVGNFCRVFETKSFGEIMSVCVFLYLTRQIATNKRLEKILLFSKGNFKVYKECYVNTRKKQFLISLDEPGRCLRKQVTRESTGIANDFSRTF